MFDNLKCEMTLPDGSKDVWDQTKDFTCQMLDHRISPEGQLYLQVLDDVVDVPKKERPYPDAPADSLMGLCGSMRYITHEEEADWSGSLQVGDFDLVFVLGRVRFIVDRRGPTPVELPWDWTPPLFEEEKC